MDGIQAQTGQFDPQIPQCIGACHFHCFGHEEEERIIRLRGDIAQRNRSLTLSMCLFVLVIGSQVGYAVFHEGKTLMIPYIEYVYAIISGAWFGTASEKLAQIIVGKKASE